MYMRRATSLLPISDGRQSVVYVHTYVMRLGLCCTIIDRWLHVKAQDESAPFTDRH